MIGMITAVFDWKPYCWDVLIDNGEGAMAFEWPRDQKPREGEMAEWIKGQGVKWRGVIIPVDLREPKIDDEGNLFFS